MKCALLLLLTACAVTEDLPDLSTAEQAEWNGSDWDPEGEVIVIEGDGWGWDAGWWFPGPGNEGPVEPPVPGGGPGPGSGTADPHPIPAPRDCTEELFHDPCYDCCDWNVDKVWGERCRRIPDKNERRKCWVDAEKKRSDCYRACPPGITTTGPATPGPAIPGVP